MNDTTLEEETIVLYEFNTELAQMKYGNTVLLVLFLIIGVVGNTVVFLTYFLKLKKSEDRYFIPFLSIFDLLSCVIGTSFSILTNERYVTFPSDILCKCLHFLLRFFSGTSFFLLLVICVQRYLKVCKPLGNQMTLRIRRISLLVTIIFSGIISLPKFFLISVNEKASPYQNITIRMFICGNNNKDLGRFVYSLVVYFAIISNVVVTVTLYVLIGRTIYRRFARLKKRKQGERPNVSGSFSTDRAISKQKPEQSHETSIAIRSSSNEPSSMKSSLAESSNAESTIYKQKGAVRRHVRNNFTYMFMTIVAIYVLSYIIPMCIVFTFPMKGRVTFWLNMSGTKMNVYLFFRRIFILSHIVNPFIYGYFDLVFRKTIKEWFCKIKTCVSCCKESS